MVGSLRFWMQTHHHTMGFFKKRSVNDLGEKKKDMPEGLWTKCPSCAESLFEQALAKNLRVCTQCGHHFTLNSDERIANICDEGSFVEMDRMLDSVDALGFKGYLDKVKAYQAKTGLMEAVVTGRGTIEGIPVVLAIMDFRFLGASMGSVVGASMRTVQAVDTPSSASACITRASVSPMLWMASGSESVRSMVWRGWIDA